VEKASDRRTGFLEEEQDDRTFPRKIRISWNRYSVTRHFKYPNRGIPAKQILLETQNGKAIYGFIHCKLDCRFCSFCTHFSSFDEVIIAFPEFA